MSPPNNWNSQGSYPESSVDEGHYTGRTIKINVTKSNRRKKKGKPIKAGRSIVPEEAALDGWKENRARKEVRVQASQGTTSSLSTSSTASHVKKPKKSSKPAAKASSKKKETTSRRLKYPKTSKASAPKKLPDKEVAEDDPREEYEDLEESREKYGDLCLTQDMEIPYAQDLGENHHVKPGASRAANKEPLRPGDVLEYYDPMGVFGDPRGRRVAQVLAIKKSAPFPLVLSNNELVPDDTRVMRIREYVDGKLFKHSGFFRSISKFLFCQVGQPSIAKANNNQVSKIYDELVHLKENIMNTKIPTNHGNSPSERSDSSDEDDDMPRRKAPTKSRKSKKARPRQSSLSKNDDESVVAPAKKRKSCTPALKDLDSSSDDDSVKSPLKKVQKSGDLDPDGSSERTRFRERRSLELQVKDKSLRQRAETGSKEVKRDSLGFDPDLSSDDSSVIPTSAERRKKRSSSSCRGEDDSLGEIVTGTLQSLMKKSITPSKRRSSVYDSDSEDELLKESALRRKSVDSEMTFGPPSKRFDDDDLMNSSCDDSDASLSRFHPKESSTDKKKKASSKTGKKAVSKRKCPPKGKDADRTKKRRMKHGSSIFASTEIETTEQSFCDLDSSDEDEGLLSGSQQSSIRSKKQGSKRTTSWGDFMQQKKRRERLHGRDASPLVSPGMQLSFQKIPKRGDEWMTASSSKAKGF